MSTGTAPTGQAPRGVDHIVFAGPELGACAARVREVLGVDPEPGGRHEGRGSHNVLVGLGERCYLEVAAVDPTQEAPAAPRWFGLDHRKAPALVDWALRVPDLERAVSSLREVGVDLGEITPFERSAPDGTLLRWRFTNPLADRLGGVVPFLIDWGESAHPAAALSGGCRLVALTAEHPEPDRVREAHGVLGVDLPVVHAAIPRLTATIETGAGVVELR